MVMTNTALTNKRPFGAVRSTQTGPRSSISITGIMCSFYRTVGNESPQEVDLTE